MCLDSFEGSIVSAVLLVGVSSTVSSTEQTLTKHGIIAY